MPVDDANDSKTGQPVDFEGGAKSRRAYVAPRLLRYGTLTDLTRKSGIHFGNDGVSTTGCGSQKETSCAHG